MSAQQARRREHLLWWISTVRQRRARLEAYVFLLDKVWGAGPDLWTMKALRRAEHDARAALEAFRSLALLPGAVLADISEFYAEFQDVLDAWEAHEVEIEEHLRGVTNYHTGAEDQR